MSMKIVPVLSALTLTAWASLASAEPSEQRDAQKRSADARPLELTDAQMDNITAGQPSGLIVIDRTLNNNNVVVAVPVNANVAANVCVIAQLCAVTDPTATQTLPGRVNIGQ